jgi:hypothetical protein
VTRRFSLSLLAIVASLAVVLAACGSAAPAAPALTDPKEILSASVLSIKDVKTMEFTGSFTGSVKAAQLGDFDLSSVKLSGAIDIPARKLKFSLDAPTLLGTKIDALVLDKVAYYKIAGPFAALLGASAEKYTKADVPTASGDPAANLNDVAASVAELKTALDKLPTPPTKGADEKCGDQDCYHVTLKMSAADLKALDPTASTTGDVSLDLWSRKSDNRPAKITFGVTTLDMGTFGMTLDIKYDVGVSVEAPPADQVVTP